MQWDKADRLIWDYGAISDTMRRHTSVKNIQESFRRMVFNILLVRITDDDPRNHAFLFGETGLELSPAYDIMPTLTQPGAETKFSLAMSVGKRGRETSLKNALSRAVGFGLSEEEASAVVEKVAETVRGWREHFAAVGCPDSEILALEPSFARCVVELRQLCLGEGGQGQGLFFNLRVQGVDFFLNVDGPFQGRDNAAVGADIVQLETPVPPILEPLLTDLIPADAIGPYGLGYRGEMLGGVDVNPLLTRIVSQPLFFPLPTRSSPASTDATVSQAEARIRGHPD